MKFLLVHCLLALFVSITSTYTIESCEGSEPAIKFAITLAQSAMIRPLLDVQQGVSSTHGYTAMYKSNIFGSSVQKLMTNILHLPITQAAGRDQVPTFVCAKRGMQQKYDIGYDPLDRCIDTGVTSFWAKDTVIVFICPSFTNLAFQPVLTPGGPQDVYCPVVQNNVFLGQSDPLVKYQNYDLVHQLAHLYLQNQGLTSQTDPKEVIDWNGCVGLGWVRLILEMILSVCCWVRVQGTSWEQLNSSNSQDLSCNSTTYLEG